MFAEWVKRCPVLLDKTCHWQVYLGIKESWDLLREKCWKRIRALISSHFILLKCNWWEEAFSPWSSVLFWSQEWVGISIPIHFQNHFLNEQTQVVFISSVLSPSYLSSFLFGAHEWMEDCLGMVDAISTRPFPLRPSSVLSPFPAAGFTVCVWILLLKFFLKILNCSARMCSSWMCHWVLITTGAGLKQEHLWIDVQVPGSLQPWAWQFDTFYSESSNEIFPKVCRTSLSRCHSLLAFSPSLSLSTFQEKMTAQILVTITASRRKPKLLCYDWGARYLPGTCRDYLYKKNFLNDFQRVKILFFLNNIRHWHIRRHVFSYFSCKTLPLNRSFSCNNHDTSS